MVLNIILQPRHFLSEPDHVYIKKEMKSVDSLGLSWEHIINLFLFPTQTNK